MCVMSLVQTRFGTSTANRRPSRFGATGRLCFESVVALYFFLAFALIPCSAMSFLTRSCPPGSPWQAALSTPRPAVLALHLGVDRLHMHQQHIVAHSLPLHRARAPAPMRVVPARAHPQHFALHRHRPAPLVAFDPGVLHSHSFAKHAVAFFRMSRSIFTRANSARNRLISICSGLTGLALVPFSSSPASAFTQVFSV